MSDKTAVIHQPDFLPYLGFFHRLLYADIFVILDDAQFLRRGWHHRDRIKTTSGDSCWLTVSLEKAPRETPINKMRLNTCVNWRQEHIDLIESSYRKAPYFGDIMPAIETIYSSDYSYLADINMTFLKWLFDILEIRIDMIFSSSLNVNSKSNQRLADICSAVSATHYLSGVGAKDYYVPEPFEEKGVTVVWQQFVHPVYPQLHGDFIPYLSSIDMLFNCGADETIKRLSSLER